ncbi:MAG: PorT family protein [Bacteroidales bacterium]|nr:PorT family protein [Bacteroidales bacterium]
MMKDSGRRIRLLTLLCGFLVSAASFAQTHYSANIAVGGHAGVDFSRVFFNPSVPQKFAVSGTAGAMFRYVEENHFGLIAELNWSQRGWKENFEDVPYRYSRTINYVEIPVMAHIYFGRRGRFFINAGPQVGVMVGETTNSNFDVSQIETLPDFPIKNRTNSQLDMKVSQKVDFGITAGIGGEFNINRKNSISAEVRFYYGLGNIMPSAITDIFRASNSMTIAATLGYWFRIK